MSKNYVISREPEIAKCYKNNKFHEEAQIGYLDILSSKVIMPKRFYLYLGILSYNLSVFVYSAFAIWSSKCELTAQEYELTVNLLKEAGYVDSSTRYSLIKLLSRNRPSKWFILGGWTGDTQRGFCGGNAQESSI